MNNKSQIMEQVAIILSIVVAISTIFVVIYTGSSFFPSDFNPTNVFSTICEGGEDSILVQDWSYGEKTAFVQIFLDDSQEVEFSYPRNTFSIISSLYDEDERNLIDAIGMYANLFNVRTKSSVNELSKCFGNSCFCKVETEADFINFDNLKYTWCFPLLYSQQKESFDAKFNELDDGSKDLDLFEEVIDSLLSEWRAITEYGDYIEYEQIISCYDQVSSLEFSYDGVSGKYFVTLDELGSDLVESGDINLLYGVLKDFYSYSKIGYFSTIHDCTVIPDKNDCLCQSDANILIHNNQVFLGMCGSRSSFSKVMNFDEVYFSRTAEKYSCKLEIY